MMDLTHLIFSLLGTTARNPLMEISENLGAKHALPLTWLAVVVGLLVAVLGLLRMRHWWLYRHLQAKPRQVFFTVARGVGIGWTDQWLLLRIASQQNLPTPLTLLLSPRTLRHHAQQYVQSRPSHRRRAIMRRVALVRRHLFGTMRREKALEARLEPMTPTLHDV